MSTDEPDLGITEADRRRLGELARRSGQVAAETCAEWRERAAAGEQAAAIAATVVWSATTVADHVRGGCRHGRDRERAHSFEQSDLVAVVADLVIATDGPGRHMVSSPDIAERVDRDAQRVGRVLKHLADAGGPDDGPIRDVEQRSTDAGWVVIRR